MNLRGRAFVFAASLVVAAATYAGAGERRAVIDDPDGFSNVRAAPDAKSAVVAKVTRGEAFTLNSPTAARNGAG